MIKLIKPYTRIQIPFISKELNIDVVEVENLLVSCILDKLVLIFYLYLFINYSYIILFLHNSTIQGRIDQVNQVLVLNNQKSTSRYAALEKWRNKLAILHTSIVSRV